MTLDGIGSISGDLIVANVSGLTTMQVLDVTSIGGRLVLASLPKLETLNLGAVTNIGELAWSDLPKLQGVGFDDWLARSDKVSIKRTGLLNLSGFGFDYPDVVEVEDNAHLDTVELSGIVNVTSITFINNAPSLNLQLGSLQFVFGNMTFQNISALSTPDLQNITGSFTCASCTMATYRAQWLLSIGSVLSVIDSQLSDLELPDLGYAGNINLVGNSQLRELNLPQLSEVGGNMRLDGVIDRYVGKVSAILYH